MKKLDLGHWLLLGVIAVLAFYLWLSPWRYERWLDRHLVRINRVTGNAEVLRGWGWVAMEKRHKIPQGETSAGS